MVLLLLHPNDRNTIHETCLCNDAMKPFEVLVLVVLFGIFVGLHDSAVDLRVLSSYRAGTSRVAPCTGIIIILRVLLDRSAVTNIHIHTFNDNLVNMFTTLMLHVHSAVGIALSNLNY